MKNSGKIKSSDTNKTAPSPQNQQENWYNASLQFYNQEISTLGQRNAVFLIIQSVLLATFATLLVNANQLPWALGFFLEGIIIAGTLFCFFYHISGRTGASVAHRWRQYMKHIENSFQDAPWAWFSNGGNKDHNKHEVIPPWKEPHKRLLNLWSRLQCYECLVTRLPLPLIWIITPALFAVVWVISAAYLIRRFFTPGDPLVSNPFFPLWGSRAIVTIVLLICILSLRYIINNSMKWWGNTEQSKR